MGAQLPLKFQAPAKAAWAETVHEPVREAYGIVMDVADSLSRIGLTLRHGHLEAGGMFKTDIVLRPQDCAGRKVRPGLGSRAFC